MPLNILDKTSAEQSYGKLLEIIRQPDRLPTDKLIDIGVILEKLYKKITANAPSDLQTLESRIDFIEQTQDVPEKLIFGSHKIRNLTNKRRHEGAKITPKTYLACIETLMVCIDFYSGMGVPPELESAYNAIFASADKPAPDDSQHRIAVDEIASVLGCTEGENSGRQNVRHTFKDGSIYEGDFADGSINGRGRLTYKDGSIYEGGFVDGKPHGKGKHLFARDADHGIVCKAIYEGDFADGKPNGEGKYTRTGAPRRVLSSVSGSKSSSVIDDLESVYEGGFKDGKYHGKGKLTIKGRSIYEGDFVKGEYNGKGKLIFEGGFAYEGDFVNGIWHGKGKHTCHIRYEGDFFNGHYHGKGTITFEDGSSCKGDFFGGRHNGKRTFMDGSVYEGDFFKDLYDGKGRLASSDGSVYEGRFRKGRYDGKGKLVFSDGSVYEGEFIGGTMNGMGKLASPDGRVREGRFVNGEYRQAPQRLY